MYRLIIRMKIHNNNNRTESEREIKFISKMAPHNISFLFADSACHLQFVIMECWQRPMQPSIRMYTYNNYTVVVQIKTNSFVLTERWEKYFFILFVFPLSVLIEVCIIWPQAQLFHHFHQSVVVDDFPSFDDVAQTFVSSHSISVRFWFCVDDKNLLFKNYMKLWATN